MRHRVPSHFNGPLLLDTTCSEVVWRVLATYSIRQFLLNFPSRASPCAITFQLECTSEFFYPTYCFIPEFLCIFRGFLNSYNLHQSTVSIVSFQLSSLMLPFSISVPIISYHLTGSYIYVATPNLPFWLPLLIKMATFYSKVLFFLSCNLSGHLQCLMEYCYTLEYDKFWKR